MSLLRIISGKKAHLPRGVASSRSFGVYLVFIFSPQENTSYVGAGISLSTPESLEQDGAGMRLWLRGDCVGLVSFLPCAPIRSPCVSSPGLPGSFSEGAHFPRAHPWGRVGQTVWSRSTVSPPRV